MPSIGFTPSTNIIKAYINAIGTGEISKKQLDIAARFKEVGEYTRGTDTNTPTGGNSGGGSGSTGGGTDGGGDSGSGGGSTDDGEVIM